MPRMPPPSACPFPTAPKPTSSGANLQSLHGALDWAAAAAVAQPWVQAVRKHPPPFWAMESLLKEYPISSAEGLALMRLAEALLRVPDAETAIALTADQLGRADFDGSADGALARLSHTAIAMSKKFLPDAGTRRPARQARRAHRGGRHAARGAAAGAAVRAGPGHGRSDARGRRRAAQATSPTCGTRYDMLGEGARTDADALRYLASYQHGIEAIAARARAGDGRSRTTTASRSSSAPCTRAMRMRSASA